MKSIRAATSLLFSLVLCGVASAANTTGECSPPADQLLHRFEIDLPGDKRVTRSVDLPAGKEILIEAFEKNIDSRLEVRAAGAEAVWSDSPVNRWPPHRVVVAKGPARKMDVTVIGLERAHGSVEVRISRTGSPDSSRTDDRCIEYWRAIARADAAYTRGYMIYRAEIEAAPGASRQAYEAAITAYQRAARILGPGSLAEAQVHLVLSQVLASSMERPQEGVDAAALAEARFKAMGDEYGRDLARLYWGYAMAYLAMNAADAADAKRKLEAAKSAFIEAAAGHLKRGEPYDQGQALVGAALATNHLFLYAEAMERYRQALAVFEKLREPERMVSIRGNLAYFEGQFGRYQEALKRHHEILAEADKIKESGAVLVNLLNTAFLELKLGKYDAALRHYSDAYERSRRTQYAPWQSAALNGLGNTYHAIGNFAEALSYLERTLELRPAEKGARERAATLRAIAGVLADTGRRREAIARREEALRIVQVPQEKARITLELIDDRIDAGDLAIATSLTAPLLAARDMPDPVIRIGATLASARIALAEGDARSAKRDARTAAEYYAKHELVSSEFAALLVQARAACAAGLRGEALDIADQALHLAEEIRTFSSNPTLRASLWRPLRPAFGFTIGLLARPGSCGGSVADPLGALAIAEASRGRALEDFQSRSSPGSAARNEQRRELFEHLAGVRQQLETLSKTVSEEDARLVFLRSEAARLRREIDLTGGLSASGRQRAEDLRTLLRARIDAMPRGMAVVEYWLGKDEAFAWLLTRGRAQLVDLGPADRIDAAARRMHDAMHSWLQGSVEDRVARARELHQLIIAPLPAELARARTLYFIPDGALHAVPFAALAQGDRPQPRFLVDAHDVAVAPAFLAIASEPGSHTVRKDAAALVVVDPVYTRSDARFARAVAPVPEPPAAAATLRGAQAWTRLPATAREAAAISKLLDKGSVQVLTGFEASRDALLERDLSRYDLLHFATHAIADTEAPQLSALVLSTLDAQGKPRIGEVFAGDLADQRLGAGLVVFSGCETALGRAEAGEGLLGLRYAAHASGARSVIASLWPVEDSAGARLMNDMYADVIGRNASPVAALSRAMRTARKSWNDPALWAAFDVSVAGF